MPLLSFQNLDNRLFLDGRFFGFSGGVGPSGFGYRYGYEFDGVDENLNFGNILDNDGTQAFSISFWVNGIVNSDWIFSKQTKRYEGMEIFSGGSRQLELTLGRTSTDRIACRSTNAIPLNEWTLCTITYTGSKTVAGVKMYLNGVEETLITVRDTFSGSSANSGDFLIGSVNWSSLYLLGRLDDVQYYDFVLSGSNVTDIYNNGYVTAPTAGPIHHWKLGEEDTFSTNWTVKDSVGSLDGTSVNMEEVDRKLGVAYSLEFDGVDEYVDYGDIDFFPQNSPFSISFWVKETGGRQGYISKTSAVYNGFVLFQNFSTVRFHLGSSEFSNRIQVSSTWTGTQDTWTHVVATYDGSENASGVKLYGNNVVGQVTNGDDLSTDVSNSSDFLIGTADVLGFLDGNMMEVSFYDTELSASDVALLFNETGTGNGVPIDPRNVGLSPTFYCPMVGPNDTFSTDWTITDEISGNNGTSVNMEESDKTSETP